MEPEDLIADESSPAVRPMLALPPRRPKLEPDEERSDTEDTEELGDESFRSTAMSNYSANDDMGGMEVTEYLREQACRSSPHPAGGIARTSGGMLTTPRVCITGPLHADRLPTLLRRHNPHALPRHRTLLVVPGWSKAVGSTTLGRHQSRR